MFKNIGQKFVSYTPLEHANNVAENAEPAVQEKMQVPELQNPIQPQAQNTSIRAEMQLAGMSWKTLLNKNLDRQLSKAELPLQKDESAALKPIREQLKPVPTEIFTGSADDQVDINRGNDNLVHVKVNGTEVWSGTEQQFKRLKIDTGDGDDRVINTVDAANIFTGAGNDNVQNTASNTSIDTGAGSDKVKSKGSNNQIETGRGSDSVESKGESNEIHTGSGNDYVRSAGDLNRIDLGDGSNTAESNGAENVLTGGRGTDFFAVGGDDNQVFAGEGNDMVRGLGDRNILDVGEGQDETSGMYGNDNEIVDPS